MTAKPASRPCRRAARSELAAFAYVLAVPMTRCRECWFAWKQVLGAVIMEVTGQSTRRMFDRYNTVDLEDTRKAVDPFQAYFRSLDRVVDQAGGNEIQSS